MPIFVFILLCLCAVLVWQVLVCHRYRLLTLEITARVRSDMTAPLPRSSHPFTIYCTPSQTHTKMSSALFEAESLRKTDISERKFSFDEEDVHFVLLRFAWHGSLRKHGDRSLWSQCRAELHFKSHCVAAADAISGATANVCCLFLCLLLLSANKSVRVFFILLLFPLFRQNSQFEFSLHDSKNLLPRPPVLWQFFLG